MGREPRLSSLVTGFIHGPYPFSPTKTLRPSGSNEKLGKREGRDLLVMRSVTRQVAFEENELFGAKGL